MVLEPLPEASLLHKPEISVTQFGLGEDWGFAILPWRIGVGDDI
jgi:hypothetical protein